jgi:amino acid transporter
MQPEFIFIASTAWLFILWFGSIALEATGMERRKARFQALSALTGTGFTTTEAEEVVNHPRRRVIASWLIFLGSVGIIFIALLLVLMIILGLKPSGTWSTTLFILSALPTVLLLVLYWLGVLDKLGTKIANCLKRSSYFTSELSIKETVHRAGDYSLARLTIGRKAPEVGSKIGSTSLAKHKITILAIERGDRTLAFPEAKEVVQAGDHLLCYGETDKISKAIK